MKKLAVGAGQTVWVRPIGNSLRQGYKDPVEGVVQSVGRKFFTVSFGSYREGKRFHLVGGMHDAGGYSSLWRVHLDRQEIDDEREAGVLLTQIRNRLAPGGYGYKISLPTLRAIDEILKAEDAKKS